MAAPAEGRTLMHALENVRVLDMGDFLAGPLGPQLLADLGAEVIKLERITGDPMRGVWAFFGCQRGKRSISVDLYSVEGQQICYKLAERHQRASNSTTFAESSWIALRQMPRASTKLIVTPSPTPNSSLNCSA